MAEFLHFPICGCRFLFTGPDFPAQCDQKDFYDKTITEPGFFIIATGAEPSQLWVAGGSYKNFNFVIEAKQMLTHIIESQMIEIIAHYIFLGNGYLQPTDAACQGDESIHYHMYLIPHGYQLIAEVYFTHGWNFRKESYLITDISYVFQVQIASQSFPPAVPRSENALDRGGGDNEGEEEGWSVCRESRRGVDRCGGWAFRWTTAGSVIVFEIGPHRKFRQKSIEKISDLNSHRSLTN